MGDSMAKGLVWLSAAAITFTTYMAPASAQHETLNRADIRAGMGTVRSNVMACSRHINGPGNVSITVSVRVAPTGFVLGARVRNPTLYPRLDSCVSASVMQARFSRTLRGRTFTYPFVFRGTSVAPPPMPVPRPFATPDRLSYRDVRRAMRWNKHRWNRCARLVRVRSPFVTRIRMRISPDGSVRRIRVKKIAGNYAGGRRNWAFRRCIRLAVKAVTFPRAYRSTRINYPLTIRSPLPPRRTCVRDSDCGVGNYCRTDEHRRSICMRPM